MTNSVSDGTTGPVGGKRERLVGAACDLVYRLGAERTTLADIARAADVPLGNVYYYFRTKDDIFARAVVDFGSKLDVSVVAEGVERAEQATILRSLGCQMAQGFYFARPAKADTALLAAA